MTTKPLPPLLSRDAYGALNTNQVLSPEQKLQLTELLAGAVKSGALPRPFITSSNKELECLNLDVYDVKVFRKRVNALVVQARSFWKHKRKGYTRSQKSHFLVVKAGRKFQVRELENATCVKRAKNTRVIGQLVGHYLGETKVACASPSSPSRLAYKVLALLPDGRLASAYDGSEYKVGEWRHETVQPHHGAGFYFYRDDALAIHATERGETFASSVSAGKKLVLCSVEVAGRKLKYDDGKWASSRLRVLSVDKPVALDVDA